MKRFDLPRLNAIVVPLLAGVLGLLVGAVMLLALGANRWTRTLRWFRVRTRLAHSLPTQIFDGAE